MKLFKKGVPCCGVYVRGLLRFGSIAGPFCGESFMVMHLTAEVFKHYDSWEKSYDDKPFDYYLRLFLWIIYGSQIFAAVWLYIVLFKAVTQKIIRLLEIYMGASAINVLIVLTTSWVYAFHFSVNLPNSRYTVIFLDALFKLYLMYGVYHYINEIKTEDDLASDFRNLTDYELIKFKNGEEAPQIARYSLDFEMKPVWDRIQYVKYMKDEFEISLLELQLDKRAPLGSGTFGTVYKAILCKNIGTGNLPVAVKTTNPLSNRVEHFKALLSELKVMTILGTHKNIVNLIGACTEDIKKRKLYIVVELCAFGNLQNYLRSQRGTFIDLTEDDIDMESLVISKCSHISIRLKNDEDVTSTRDLVKWANEIADGMDFLQSRRVVHGDLAARNVLLTEYRVAKITDFGLSRQLYNYSVYMKTQNSPLPWRWLSLEAIMDMCFSTQSDVWAYAVTLWELFQLGEIPWPGHKFCVDFVKELKRGKRLQKPRYSSRDIYQIMLTCWEEDPEKRPTFKKLSEDFQAIYQQLNDVLENIATR